MENKMAILGITVHFREEHIERALSTSPPPPPFPYGSDILTLRFSKISLHVCIYIYIPRFSLRLHSVHHPPFCRGWGGLNLLNFQKGGYGRASTLRGGCWKRRGNFFQGVLQFLQKKIKFEIFNDKKISKQKYFSLS